MSKPMKPKTSGLSAGPTAYWDARSDAIKDAKIKQQREEIKRLMDGMESAFVLLANGEISCTNKWQAAFEKWRDQEWHPALARNISGKRLVMGERLSNDEGIALGFADAEIEQLGKRNERLREENERLRELLLRCKPQIEAGYGFGRIDRELVMELEKELGDE